MFAADDVSLAGAARHDAAAARIGTARNCLQRALQTRLDGRPLLADTEQLIDYLTFTASFGQVEQVRALFLNAKLELLRDDLVGSGCIAEAPVYVRPILKRALDLGASAMILAHNHPSGDPTPSAADCAITRELERGLEAIGVQLIDHIVLAQGRWITLRSCGLL